jgi:hypothetical protein
MITIKMHQNDWRIIMGDEIWEFGQLEDMKKVLDKLLNFKDEWGRIKKEDKWNHQ